ncbi:NB-ARC domain-containing protein [Streptomyces cyaneofuscatus]|uniref:AfsR/SARP family transcriptional regulator n=1 Tax=Streptomyces cyaneofuscatus TaxID=66883 RepID=UPI00386BAFC1|nr:NB-ARC domain-containing protein [Streptomyces cyaneofuscatus]
MAHVFRVLGPVEVSGPSGTLIVHSSRQRVILSLLILSANQPVSVPRLIDAIWSESPPSTAKGQVQICVSQLRRSLGDIGLGGRICTKEPGYEIRIEEDELDLTAFERDVVAGLKAARDGSPADCVRYLRRGLALWHGEPLAGVDSRSVRAVALRMAERRLGVLEECIHAELQLGMHREVLTELMELVDAHPLRERLRGLQMTALNQAGRQADALAAYQDTRRELIEQLGVEPPAELRRLQMEILTGGEEEPEERAAPPPGPPPEPRLLPRGIPDLTDRSSEAGLMREALLGRTEHRPGAGPATAGARSGNGTDTGPGMKIVTISGMGGVGKTSLAIRVAHDIADEYPDGQLFAQLREGGIQPVGPERILGRFLRALGSPSSEIPSGLQERAEMYRHRVADRRLLVVLDDAADENQVFPLLPGGDRCAVLVTGRLRLSGIPGSVRIHLDELDSGSAMTMFERLVGRDRVLAEPSDALRVVHQCGGLPLALRMAAARLAARPHWTVGQLAGRLSDEGGRLDALAYGGNDMRASIMVSYQDLERDAQRLLARLALCEASEFPGWIAGPLMDRDPDATAELLDSLVDAQLVDTSWSPVGTRYRLHELIRVFARERLACEDSASEQVVMLRRVMGVWLSLIDEAHSRTYGGDYTLVHSGAERRRLPDVWVEQLLADPMEWLDTERSAIMAAIGQAADLGADEICWDLALGMTTLYEARGYFEDWREAVETALSATLRAGNRRGEAALLYARGVLDLSQRRFGESRASLTAARSSFEELGEKHGAALALRNLAWLDRNEGGLETALDRATEALALLEEAGDLAGVAHTLYQIGQVDLELRRHAEAKRCCTRAMEIGRTIGSTRVIAQAGTLMGAVHTVSAEPAEAERALNEALGIVRSTGDKAGETYALYGLGVLRLSQDSPALAEQAFRHARALALESGDHMMMGKLYMGLGEVYDAQGRPAPAAATTSKAVNVFEKIGARLWRDRAAEQLHRISLDGRPSPGHDL